MAAAVGRENIGLSSQLLQEAHRFDFFQAVRLLEQLFRERACDDPRWLRFPVGHDHAPEREVVRFRAVASLSFPAGAVARIQRPAGQLRGQDLASHELQVAFLGLTGPSGVLPHHYTALLLRRVRDKDFSLRDFLDLFNHRIISLFYRAREKYRMPFAYERAKAEGSDSTPASRAVFCLAGFGTPGLLGRIGPLTYARFRSLMPNGGALIPLVQLTRTFVGLELDFDVQAVLLPEEVPWCRLGASDDQSYLGWNSWLRSGSFDRDVDDAVFEAENL
jgi:predicted component of type VI protein secretion system